MGETALQSALYARWQYLYTEPTEHDIQNIRAYHMTNEGESVDIDLATVIDLLDDEYIRSILVETSDAPMSANELSELYDLSTSSIYRRLDRLTEVDLVGERTRPRADGHHETVYIARLDRFELAIRDGNLAWEIDRRSDDVADQLTRLWRKF
nr:winged helix-turn-helix domain-containing protein [Halorussus marinus]